MAAKSTKLSVLAASGIFGLVLAALPRLTSAFEVPLPNAPSTLSSDPGAYIQYFFTFGLGLVGFLAVAAIVIGGIMYMTGSTMGKVDRAKTIIAGAITGIVLLLCSYLLLAIIDPTLTNLSPLKPATAPGVVPVASNLTQSQQQAATNNWSCCSAAFTCSGSFNSQSACLASCPVNTGGYDCSPGQQQGAAATQQNATITGSGQTSCSISTCGSQTVQGKTLSVVAAAKYSALQQQIQQACAAQGLTCSTQLTSTIDGTHASTCHDGSNAQKGGTCGDLVITTPACGGSIKNCSASQQNLYMTVASQAMAGSNNVSSCLNEYIVAGSEYSTGGHFHCNF